MRYLEFKDKNDKPIFEGDELLLTIKDKSFGGSHFGKFCKFFDIDTVKIKTLENSNILQIKYVMTFFKDDVQIVTNQENEYWSHCDECEEKGIELEKTVEDFFDTKNATGLLDRASTNSKFFQYLTVKGVEKVGGFDGNEIIEEDKDLRIQTDFSEDVLINDSLIITLDDDFKKRINIEEDKDMLNIGKYTHLRFDFKRLKGFFDSTINVSLTDETGNCKVFDILLNKIGENKLGELNSQIFRLEMTSGSKNKVCNKSEIKKLQDEKALLYSDKDCTKEEENRVWFGFKNEVNVISYAIKNGYHIEKMKRTIPKVKSNKVKPS